MKIAIHHRKGSFSKYWIEYCKQMNYPFKIVNCYDSSIINDIDDCNALMWHFHHADPKDVLFAKQLVFSLQETVKKMYPDFNTAWHFDDKVGQKYLLEAVKAPLVPSYVFYSKKEAKEWLNNVKYPLVFKLRRGSGSAHVKLVRDKKKAHKLVDKAFKKGFSQYDSLTNLKERWRKFRNGKSGIISLLKGIVRFAYSTEFQKVTGNEKGYVYFQDFIPGNEYDIRVIVIDNKAFAIKRLNRKNDFRASGSGYFLHEKHHFNDRVVRLSLDLAKKLKCQSLAIDFVYSNDDPMIVELSYGFPSGPFVDNCSGYWDSQLNWHEGPFNPYGWMVESLLNS